MDLGSLLAEGLGGLFSALSGNQNNQQANQANALAQQEANTQDSIVKYLLNKSQNVLDPVLENTVIPAMVNRVNNGPSFAGMASTNEKRLTQPFTLSSAVAP